MVISPEGLEKRVKGEINAHFQCIIGEIDEEIVSETLKGDKGPFTYLIEDSEVPDAIRGRVFRKVVTAYSNKGWNAKCEVYYPETHLFTFNKKKQ